MTTISKDTMQAVKIRLRDILLERGGTVGCSANCAKRW